MFANVRVKQEPGTEGASAQPKNPLGEEFNGVLNRLPKFKLEDYEKKKTNPERLQWLNDYLGFIIKKMKVRKYILPEDGGEEDIEDDDNAQNYFFFVEDLLVKIQKIVRKVNYLDRMLDANYDAKRVAGITIDANGKRKRVYKVDDSVEQLFRPSRAPAQRQDMVGIKPDLIFARRVAGFMDGKLEEYIEANGVGTEFRGARFSYRFTPYLESYFDLAMQNIKASVKSSVKKLNEWSNSFLAFEYLYNLDNNNITAIANYTAYLISNRLSLAGGYQSEIQVANQNQKAKIAYDQILVMLNKHDILDPHIKKINYIK